MTHAAHNTGSQLPVEPGTVWGDMVEALEDKLNQTRTDWYIGVDPYGQYFLSAEGLHTVWYPRDVFSPAELAKYK